MLYEQNEDGEDMFRFKRVLLTAEQRDEVTKSKESENYVSVYKRSGTTYSEMMKDKIEDLIQITRLNKELRGHRLNTEESGEKESELLGAPKGDTSFLSGREKDGLANGVGKDSARKKPLESPGRGFVGNDDRIKAEKLRIGEGK